MHNIDWTVKYSQAAKMNIDIILIGDTPYKFKVIYNKILRSKLKFFLQE